MVADIFRSGRLMLPQEPLEESIKITGWGDILTNKILVVLSVVLLLVFLLDIIRFLPTASYCLKRAKGSINLEHSLSEAKNRNSLALLFILPFCLIIDRVGLISRDYIQATWSVFSVMGLLTAYCLVRLLAYTLCYPRKKTSADTAIAAHRAIFTFFIVLTEILLITMGILSLFHAEIELSRKVVLWEITVLYALAFLRTGQILAVDCNGFSTILYLCGLEVVPTGLLVASVLYF